MIIYTLRVQRRCCGFQLWETLNSKGGIGVEDTRIVVWALKTVSGSGINIQLRTSDLDDSHWHGMVWDGARFQCGTKITAGIDHFHYDVTRAKVSGSCSKDRAQCRAIAGKCQKISRSAMSAKASYQVFYKVMCSIATQIQRNSAWSFFFSINEELRLRVLLTNISVENFFPKFWIRSV